MVKKRKVVRKKPVSKAKVSKVEKKSVFSSVRLGIIVRNLVLFVLLALISWILYVVLDGVLRDIFEFLWIIFGFISVAFFLALFVLLFIKLFNRIFKR